ncbi:MAG TPA: hypothetical protein VLA68_01975, partial [Nitrososphaera sp.]|nr:hypothetical protein [Nitrososphaera sp.]
ARCRKGNGKDPRRGKDQAFVDNTLGQQPARVVMLVVKGVRACPICPTCGSKKFRVIEHSKKRAIVECLSCAQRISI